VKEITNVAAEAVNKEITECILASDIKKIRTVRKLQNAIPASSVRPANVLARNLLVSNVFWMSSAKTQWHAQRVFVSIMGI
jgi:hypothetical protein